MQKSKQKKRLVVDVNTWISSLLTHEFHVRTLPFFASEYQLVFSEHLFHELNQTVHKPKFVKRINRAGYAKLVSLLERNVEFIDVRSEVVACRDPKDDYLLALAKDGNADYLITGDKDLLVMKAFGKTKIVTLTDFETDVK